MHILYKLFIRVFYLFQNIINEYYFNFGSHGDWGSGIGDWGLGIGDWGFGPIPQPQTPNPQPPFPNPLKPN